MVAIIPNRAELEGKIISIRKERSREHFHAIRLKLMSVAFLKGENLLSELESGNEATVLIATEILRSNKIKKGMVISCNIRKAAGPEYFIIPDTIRISASPEAPEDD